MNPRELTDLEWVLNFESQLSQRPAPEVPTTNQMFVQYNHMHTIQNSPKPHQDMISIPNLIKAHSSIVTHMKFRGILGISSGFR